MVTINTKQGNKKNLNYEYLDNIVDFKLYMVAILYLFFDIRFLLRNFSLFSWYCIILILVKGSHCLDFPYTKSDDPKWLKKQRENKIKGLPLDKN